MKTTVLALNIEPETQQAHDRQTDIDIKHVTDKQTMIYMYRL